jgi:hypothetical protein
MKTTVESSRIMLMTEISIDFPKRRSTTAGRVKGTRRDEATAMTMTRGLFAPSRLEINGATTPVEMPLRSKADKL